VGWHNRIDVGNDPVNRVDPFGLFDIWDIITPFFPSPKITPFLWDWILPPSTSNIYPILCQLSSTDIQDGKKVCFYDCPAPVGWTTEDVGECESCKRSLLVDENNYNRHLPITHIK